MSLSFERFKAFSVKVPITTVSKTTFHQLIIFLKSARKPEIEGLKELQRMRQSKL